MKSDKKLKFITRVIKKIIYILETAIDKLDEEQDPERTYWPAEQQLNTRLDRTIMRLETA